MRQQPFGFDFSTRAIRHCAATLLVVTTSYVHGQMPAQQQATPRQPSQNSPSESKPAPDTPEARKDFDVLYSFLQTSGYSRDGLTEGTRRAEDFARKYPGTALSYAGLGEVRYIYYQMTAGCKMGDDVSMLARKAIAINPGSAEGHILAAKIALCTRHPAFDWHAEQAIKLAPDKPEAMFVKARALQLTRDFRGSEAMFRRNIDALKDPLRKSNIFFWLGQMLTSDERNHADIRADLNKSEEAYRQMVQLDPNAIGKQCTLIGFLVQFRENVTPADKLLRKSGQQRRLCDGSAAALVDYSVWAKNYQAGHEGASGLKKIQIETGLSPDQAFVLSARFMARGDVVRALLKAKAISNINTIGNGNDRGLAACCQAIVNAAYQGNTELVDFLIKNGANVNAAGDGKRTPLVYALFGENVRMTELLLANGARPNSMYDDGDLPLEKAIRARQNSTALVAALLKYRASPNADGRPPLMSAISVRNLEALKLLLAHGADPNARIVSPENPANFSSPVTQSIQMQEVEMFAALLAAGARPEMPTMDALTFIQGSIRAEKDPAGREKLERMRALLVAQAGKAAK